MCRGRVQCHGHRVWRTETQHTLVPACLKVFDRLVPTRFPIVGTFIDIFTARRAIRQLCATPCERMARSSKHLLNGRNETGDTGTTRVVLRSLVGFKLQRCRDGAFSSSMKTRTASWRLSATILPLPDCKTSTS